MSNVIAVAQVSQRRVAAADAQDHSAAGDLLNGRGSGSSNRRMARDGVGNAGAETETFRAGRRQGERHIGVGRKIL